MVKATDSNFDYLFPSGSAGSNPAGVVLAVLTLSSIKVPDKVIMLYHDIMTFERVIQVVNLDQRGCRRVHSMTSSH